jgi:hypothetical protein
MAIFTFDTISWWMVFIFCGFSLCKPYMNHKIKRIAKMQKSTQKDVEKCFGVLHSKFTIIQNPCKLWHDVLYDST